jgi:hypothetical protein
MVDVEEGTLRGPFSAAEIGTRVGPLWTAARRFAIRQKEKLRPIDDFSASGLNAAFGTMEKADMKGIDQTVACARAWAHSLSDGTVCLASSDGSVNSVPLHPDWSESSWLDLVGRVTDLKKAYKQLPAHPADRAFSLVGVRGLDGEVKLFEALSLMFGATAAVYGFLRFSRALSALGTFWLRLILVEFFDDFTQLEPAKTSDLAQTSFEDLLLLLGWNVSLGEKRLPFASRFASLGIEIDLSKTLEQTLELHNKPGRVEAIIVELDRLLSGKVKVGFKDALSIRGKLAYAEGQTFGRVLAPTTRVLSRWVQKRGAFYPDLELRAALLHARNYLSSAGPRLLRPQLAEDPVLIFTDGACEETTSIGGVLIHKGTVQCFGAVVPDSLVHKWKSKDGQVQVIGQAEIFPVLVARLTWRQYLRGRKCIFFLDNESARIAIVRSYSPVLASLNIVMDVAAWDFKNEVDAWYTRVPTCANISDGPSRMCLDEMGVLGAFTVVKPIFPDVQPTMVL